MKKYLKLKNGLYVKIKEIKQFSRDLGYPYSIDIEVAKGKWYEYKSFENIEDSEKAFKKIARYKNEK